MTRNWEAYSNHRTPDWRVEYKSGEDNCTLITGLKENDAKLIASTPAMLELLTDIHNHLKSGATIHPGSLIFKEDIPAIDVINSLIIKIK